VGNGGRSFFGFGLLEVVGEFLVLASIVDRKFEFTFFGPEDDGLAFHAADHVEGRLGLAAQGQLQEVVLDAGLDGLAQLARDFKVAVGRAKAFDALVRPLVIIVFDPQPDAFPRRLEALELRSGEELLPDAFPEAFDFAQGHRVMRPGFEVVGPVLFHLGLEARGTAPVDVLPAVIGEHLFGWLVLGGRNPKYLQHVIGCVAAEQIGSNHEPRVIIHEADQVGVAAAQSEGEDIGLPHLVRGSPFEETRAHEVPPWFWWRLDQTLLLECFADGFGAGLQKEYPLEQLGDLLNAAGGFLFFELEDFVTNGSGQLWPWAPVAFVLQALLALPAIDAHPLVHASHTDTHLLGDQFLGEALFEVQFDGSESFVEGPAIDFFRRSPPRGGRRCSSSSLSVHSRAC